MTQQATPARRSGSSSGSVGDREPVSAPPTPAAAVTSSSGGGGRAQTPSRQFPDRKGGSNTNTLSSKQPSGGARATSTPKQRGKSGGAPTSSQAPLPVPPPPPSRYDVALAKMKQAAEGKSEEELQLLLQTLLRGARFADAAYLIAASAVLAAKFKTSDVVRLMLEHKQFEQTAQLIREMKLQANQLLVTLFVKELVRNAQFHAAVRYAQEMVQNFGKKDFGPRELERPSWTPQALIQAMVRALQFRTALKFAKQFELLETFPVLPLVANMFEARQWEDAVSSVMEFRLFADFPVDALVSKMLAERQWSLAVKCMGKAQSKEALDKFAEALVREAARAGDFVSARRYLGEYKLDQAPAHRPLLEYLIATMIMYKEMYKAIKYSIKFGLDAAPEGEEGGAPFPTKSLILKAVEIGQFHVANLYIKKLRLRDQFASELAEIAQKQQVRLQEFREFVGFREAQVSQPTTQHELAALLGDKMETDADFVVVGPTTTEVIVSETEEVFPRRKKETEQQTLSESAAGVGDRALDAARSSEAVHQDGGRQSRFSFARAGASEHAFASVPSRAGELSQYEHAQAPQMPPGLAPIPAAARAEESSSSFNFAQFASALQSNTPLVPAPVQQSQSSAHSAPPGMQPAQSRVQTPPAPPGMQSMPPSSQASMFAAPMPASHHFGRGPMQPPHPGYAPLYPQGGFMQPMNGTQAPPPAPFMTALPPPPSAQQNANGGFSGMDISSLAMQFHSGGSPAFGGGLSFAHPQMHPQAPPPPPTHSSPGALSHLFPSAFVPPLPPPQFAQPPRSSFKPSIGYTSVTTTRQKK